MKRRFKKRAEKEIISDQMNGGIFAALAVYTLWYGYKLFRGKDTTVIVMNDGIETEPVYCSKTDRIIYVVKE